MKIYYSYIDKFHNIAEHSALSKRQKEHLLGRRIVQDVAKSVYGIDDEIITTGKRPHFKNNGIYFSISHSENIVVVAFSEEPVGIDVEFIKPRNLPKLIKRYDLDIKSTLEGFYEWWTAYEAKYKNPAREVYTFKLLPDYICSLAYDGIVTPETVDIIEF